MYLYRITKPAEERTMPQSSVTQTESEAAFAKALEESILATPADWSTEAANEAIDLDFAALEDFEEDEDTEDGLEDIDAALAAALANVQSDLDAARAEVAAQTEAAWNTHEAAQDTTGTVQGRADARADLHATAHASARNVPTVGAPEVVRARLVWYIGKLETLPAGNITSARLAAHCGNTADQVRKDFNNFGAFGKRGVGYDVATLTTTLRNLVATCAKVAA